MAAAALGGVGPGLVSTFASLLLVNFVFGHFNIHDHGAMGRQVIWVVASIGVSLLAGMQRAARMRELRQREWLRVTLASIGDGVLATDDKGLVTFLNPMAEALAGWKLDEAVGQPIARVFPIIHEQTRQPAADIVGQVLREKGVVTLANHTVLMSRDGCEIPIEDSAAPIMGAANTVAGVVLVFHDVTQRRRVQEELRQSETRFRTMADAIPQLAWIAQADGYITWYNRRWFEYTGTTPEQMEGWGWQSVHDPQVLPKVLEQWTASIANGEPFDMVFPLRGADGRFRPFLTRGMPLKDTQGRVVQWFGTNTDIDEMKRAEEALARLAAIVESSDDAIIGKTQGGIINTWNGGAERIFGYTAEEAIGQPITIIIPDDRKDEELAILERLRRGVHIDHYETVRIARDGRRIDVSLSLAAIKDSTGNVIGVSKIVRDITERKRAEEMVRESEERLRFALETCHTGAWDLDLVDHTAYRSLEHDRIFGYAELLPQWTYEMFIEHVLPEERETVDGKFRHAMENRSDWSFECRIVRTDGQVRWIWAAGRHRPDATGVPRRMAGIVQDITERKRAEDDLRKSERRYSALFANKINGMAHCRTLTDEHGRPVDYVVLEINEAYERIIGVKKADIEGRRVTEVFPDIKKYALDYIGMYGKVALEGGEIKFEEFFEATGQCLSIYAYSPLPGEFIAIFSDVTERKQAEEELERQREWLNVTLTSIGDGVITCDTIGRVTFINPVAEVLSGWKIEEAVGQPIQSVFRIINEKTRQPAEDIVGRVLREKTIVELANHTALVTKEGGEVSIEDSAAPIMDHTGNVGGVVLVFHNVTDQRFAREELRAANAQLAEADRRKDEFLAMLAHELRNPLSPVRSAVEILRLAGPKDPILLRQRDIIDRQITHMARLLDDLLDVSRVTRGKIELKRQPLHLDDVLVHAAETATPLIESRRHTLTLTLPPDSLRVEGDIDRLAQAVGNLLTNSAKYTEEGGRIWLEAAREADEAVIRVRDTGSGIAPEMLPRVFELFAQADCTLAHAKGGLGIGLTMVKRLVELHGGSVEARSAGLGQGSEFIIRLPALEGEAPAPVRPDKPEEHAPAPARRILVVDDIADSADSLAQMLTLSGHEARAVYDGPRALKILCDFVPDVVLLDIGMPGMDGYEVARRMREKECGRKTLLVALTGYAQESDREAAREAGFDHHLAKPVDLDALRELLAHADTRLV